jgi:integrase
VFSAEDLETLELGLQALTKAKKLEAGHADLVRFLALSGLRRGEALGLRWKDINLD